MSTQIQRRRGTTAEHASFTGALGETTVDTDKDTVVVHDGTTVGGHPLMRENGSNSALALGSAGTPSLKFTGDTNTGIYSPGADQVAISTGGSGRLFVDSNGNLGVGISSIPNYNVNLRTVSFNNTNGVVHDYAVGGTRTGSLVCQSTGFEVSTQTAIPLVFSTNSSEKMRITSAGLVGVGTSSPVYLVDVQGGRSLFTANSETYSVGVRNRASLAPNGNFWIGATNSTTPDMVFSNNTGTERMRITDTGLVGIGTSSPGSALELSSAATSAAGGLTVTNTNASGYSTVQFKNTGASGRTYTLALGGNTSAFPGSVYLYDDTAGATRFLIDSSGRLGIGNTVAGTIDAANGAGNLVVGSGSGTEGITIYSGTADAGILNFADGTSSTATYVGQIAYRHNEDSLAFSTGATERARIDSAGRWLLGTSSARSPFSNNPLLQVENQGGGNAVVGSFTFNANGGAGPNVTFTKSRGTTSGAVTVVQSGDTLGEISFAGTDGTNIIESCRIAAFVDGTPGANDMPGRLVFSTTADSASSPTERLRITNTGAVLINTTTTATNALFEVSSNGTKKSFQVYNNDNVQLYSLGTGTVYSNGGVLTNTNPSDERLKDNIESLSWGLEQVMALRPVSFDWKNNPTNQGKQYGFIAQEVQSVMPELVNEFETVDGDETVTRLGLEKDGIYAAMVKALQEQQAMIIELQAKVAALESA